MSNYQYILLDWDGNLAKTLHIWIEAFNYALTQRGISCSREEVAMSVGAFVRSYFSHRNMHSFMTYKSYVRCNQLTLLTTSVRLLRLSASVQSGFGT